MKKLILAIVMVGALIGASSMVSNLSNGWEKEDVGKEAMDKFNESAKAPKPKPNLKKATMTPGRVVELDTTRGRIAFVLYEKDCPRTAGRVADLVQKGCYDGVSFPRVENWVIQTDKAKADVKPMGIEVLSGLTHAKGTVGMARTTNLNSNTSIFYITLEPAPHLDTDYTNFGRLIRGMDVAMKIKKGDIIKHARLLPLTKQDTDLFHEVLKIEAERRTQ